MNKHERNISEDYAKSINIFFKDFNKTLDSVESKMEAELIELFSKLQIQSSVKSDKYSLPYQHEIEHNFILESYVNGFLEYERMFPKIAKEVLNSDACKIRFYVSIVPYESTGTGLAALFNRGLTYRFRYFIH